MDHRENTPRLANAKQYYEDQGDTVQIKDLLIGDYLFNNQVVFEYKTLEDFIKSVQESRVFNQAIDQTQAFPCLYSHEHYCLMFSTGLNNSSICI